MMRAILSRQPGGPETLEMAELPMPVATDDQLLIRTACVALNYPDVLMIADKYQARPPRPFMPGCELSGIVEAVGSGVQGFSVGDRVTTTLDYGALAEYTVAQAARSFVIPYEMPFDIGASLLITYGTAIHGLVNRGRIESEQTLLVLGASGGVGLAAVELGKALGAKVVAGTSSAEKSAVADRAGADRSFVYPRGPFDADGKSDLRKLMKEAVGPGGADLIFDPLGGDYSEAAVRAIAWNGRMIVIGFVAGIGMLPLNLPLLKECEVTGVFWGEFTKRDPLKFRAQIAQLLNFWRQGAIKPLVSRRYRFEDAGEAIGFLSGGHAVGKLVVDVNPELI